MGVVGRWAGGEEGGLPTPLDFSTKSGWNSVPSLPVSPSIVTSKLYLSQQPIRICQDQYQLTANMPYML